MLHELSGHVGGVILTASLFVLNHYKSDVIPYEVVTNFVTMFVIYTIARIMSVVEERLCKTLNDDTVVFITSLARFWWLPLLWPSLDKSFALDPESLAMRAALWSVVGALLIRFVLYIMRPYSTPLEGENTATFFGTALSVPIFAVCAIYFFALSVHYPLLAECDMATPTPTSLNIGNQCMRMDLPFAWREGIVTFPPEDVPPLAVNVLYFDDVRAHVCTLRASKTRGELMHLGARGTVVLQLGWLMVLAVAALTTVITGMRSVVRTLLVLLAIVFGLLSSVYEAPGVLAALSYIAPHRYSSVFLYGPAWKTLLYVGKLQNTVFSAMLGASVWKWQTAIVCKTLSVLYSIAPR